MNRLKLLAVIFTCMSLNAFAAPMDDAFVSGKSLGNTNKQTTANKVTAGSAQDTIPAYGQNTPEKNYFSGGNGSTNAYGVAKLQSCAQGGQGGSAVQKQECEAVNFLSKNPEVRPQFTITANDSMIQKTRVIQNDPSAIIGNLQSSTETACVPKTVTTPAKYDTKTCVSLNGVDAPECTIGRVVNINTDANYQCDKTLKSNETVTCRKNAIVTVTSSTQQTGFSCATGSTLAVATAVWAEPMNPWYVERHVGLILECRGQENVVRIRPTMWEGTYVGLYGIGSYHDVSIPRSFNYTVQGTSGYRYDEQTYISRRVSGSISCSGNTCRIDISVTSGYEDVPPFTNSVTFSRPRGISTTVYTATTTWENGCASFEGRAQ